MFEDIATSAANLLIVTFLVVIAFMLVWGTLWVRSARQTGK